MKKATQSKAWTTVQIARHPERPQFLDYVGEILQSLMHCMVIVCLVTMVRW